MLKKVIAILVIAIMISLVLIHINEQQFDENSWRNNPTERYKMSKDIIENQLFAGKSKQELIEILGEPAISKLEGRDHVMYSLGKAPSFFESNNENLIVIFVNDTVSNVLHTIE